MRFWLMTVLLYLICAAVGLGLPGVQVLGGELDPVASLGLDTVAFIFLIFAAVNLVLMVARITFPRFWWMAQIEGKDIYHYRGVYFMGMRQSRQRSRLYKLVFGVEESMRRWDLIFGLLILTLAVPHLMGGYTVSRAFARIAPHHPRLHQTLHSATLSGLPVLREWNVRWEATPEFSQRVERALREAGGPGAATNASRFRLAELQLLNAFQLRESILDPFRSGPGDRVVFDRNKGAEALVVLNQLLAQPALDRAGWSRSALALIGFFHLSDRNYPEAASFLERALAAPGEADASKLSQYQVVLLAAQAALMTGDTAQAVELLQKIIGDERLPPRAYALAWEHLAGAMRLEGQGDQVDEVLQRTLKMYRNQDDRSGIARVHLRMAANALERGDAVDAGRQLSLAASLAHGLQDGFTLNMVEGLAQSFARVL